MSQILNKIHEIDPNNSEAIKETVGVFFHNLLKHVQQDSNRWLQALEDVISRFPKFCINHRTTLESFIVKFVDSYKLNNVIRAAKCAHLLQQVKTTNPKLGWKQQMALLCSAAQHLTEELFSSTFRQEIQVSNPQTVTPLVEILQNVTKVSQENVDKNKTLFNRLRNIHIFIQAMLVEIYPSAKPIQPQTILDIVVQVLTISRTRQDNIEDIVLIKCEALRTLDALIACLGPNLIPYSPLVLRLVMQTLRWTSDNSNDHTKAVRRHAYSSLRQWLMVLHVYKITDSRNFLEDELTTHIINDITPPTKVVELTMGPQPTRNMSKKAQKKLKARQINDSSLPSLMPKKNKISVSDELNSDVAIAALECLETLFIVSGVFLKPTTHKVLQERLLRESHNLSSYSGTQGLAILRALDAARTCGYPRPPTQHCLRIYSEHSTSVQKEIASFCSRALLDIRLHLHCSPSSLNFAVQAEPEKATNKQKRVSEKNRAMLESLLGKDVVPTNDEEEIITIPDEPVNKKARIDDSADKFSLSSDDEVMSSVEISDDSGTEDVQEVQIDNESEAEVQAINEVENISQKSTQSEAQITTLSKEINETNTNVNSSPMEVASHAGEEKSTEMDKNVDEDVNGTEEADAPTLTQSDATKSSNIHDAPTQLPFNESADTLDGDERPHSLEVGYDYPNTGNEKVPVLERLDDVNLPSTNETDDIQITCGQELKSSPDMEAEKKSSDADIESVSPKVNGILSPENITDINIDVSVTECDSTNVVPEKNVLSVEDMMADFVDEVNDEA